MNLVTKFKRTFVAVGLFLLASAAIQAQGADAPTPKGASAIKHTFVCGDYVAGRVMVVSDQGKVEWEYPAPLVCDLWVLPSGNFLFTTGDGVKEVTREKKEVFSYKAVSGEIFTCQRLPDGNTLIGECTNARLVEVNPKGQIVKEVKLTVKTADPHSNFRQARKLSDGTYVVGHMGDGKVRQYDGAGKILREIDAPSAFMAAPLPNGNLLISCGDTAPGGSKVFEIDPKGKVVWEVKGDDLKGIQLTFMAGVQRLPNGNTLMCNWLGHGHIGNGVHMLEVTPDKKVVWSYADHAAAKTVSTAQLLDDDLKKPVKH